MKQLNLYRLWEAINKLSEKETQLGENDINVCFLGGVSNYVQCNYEKFLMYHQFKINENHVLVYDDPEYGYCFSRVNINLLTMNDEEIDLWMESEINQQQKNNKQQILREKQQLEHKLQLLNKEIEEFNGNL